MADSVGKKIAGVLGWPVAQSLSPKLHTYWLDQYGIEGEYLTHPCAPDELENTIRTLHARGWAGCNVTIPHKEEAMRYLDDIDPVAQAIGAVNTIVVKEGGKLWGTNTDAYGFAENIRPFIGGTKKAVVLGAGGAAKAILKALQDLGFSEIIITNRTAARARDIQRGSTHLIVCPWEGRSAALENADLLVNTTSLGMEGKEPLVIDLAPLPQAALVTDIVYRPLITPLMEAAQLRGNKVRDGLGMLIHQAIPGFEAWFGAKPRYNEELKTYLLS